MIKYRKYAAPMLAGLCAMTVTLIAACSGGGGGGGASTPSPSIYLLGGTVTGLAPGGTLTLSNGSDVVAVNANGNFSFPRKLSAGESYTVASISSPGHTCTLTDAAATVAKADVTTIKASCLQDPRLLAGVEKAFQNPVAIAVDGDGNTFVYDATNAVIRKVTAFGVLSTYAGVPRKNAAVDGPAATAQFANVSTMIADRAGNLIVGESCGLVRKVTKDGLVSTVAGSPSSCTAASPSVAKDGEGQSAVFRAIYQIALDANGDYLVLDGREAIRRVPPAGVVTTMSWTSSAIPGSADVLKTIYTFTVDKSGIIYAFPTTGSRIWKISAGVATVVAGGAKIVDDRPVDGQGSAAGFLGATAMTSDSAGNVYFADFSSLRKLTPDGTVSTVAGYYNRTTLLNGTIDGTGVAANFIRITALAMAPNGNVIAVDGERGMLRSVTPAGVVSTPASVLWAQQYLDGDGAGARFSSYSKPAVDPQGNLYLFDANVLRKITRTGTVSRYAGKTGVHGTQDGAVDIATFDAPGELAIDPAGSMYFLDAKKVRKISAGTVTTLTEPAQIEGAKTIAVSAEGTLAVTGANFLNVYSPHGTLLKRVEYATVAQALGAPVLSNGYFAPTTAVFDSAGNSYFGDLSSGVVLKLSKDFVLTKFSGKPRADRNARLENQDGSAETATFAYLGSPTIDTNGNIYIISMGALRMISPLGVVSTPPMPWENLPVSDLAFGNGKLYGMSKYALLQMPVP